MKEASAELLNIISGKIIAAAIEVHNYLGPGLLEETYKQAFYYELILRGFKVEKEIKIPIIYKGVEVGYGKADLVVDDLIIIELKSTESNLPIFSKQLYNYLKLSGKKLGLLINFDREYVKDGIKRVVNSL